ncbi:MAG: hypothetical protein FJ030_04635 [Chloroflexi bacterium]|nr:hypothetical protein [Chloroflexota bacterium]
MTELTGSTTELSPGGYTLNAPGMVGTVTEMSASESATRSDSGVHETHLNAAVERAGIFAGKVYEINITEDTTPPGGSTTRADGLTAVTREGEPAIVCAIPSMGESVGYAMLYTDEAGMSRWIFPESAAPTAEATRGGAGEVVFHLPRASAPVPPEAAADESQTRGPISKIGRRLVRVLAWATDDIVGKGALALAKNWEEQNRPYGFHRIEPDQYQGANPTPAPMDWEKIRGGRALLLLHGTFSTSEGSYALLLKSTLEKLAHHYGGRIFAFNHPSLHHSPAQNAQTFFDMLPEGISLELDVMTHSRGGLVGRELTERQMDVNTGGRAVKIHKSLMVASPNQGTILVDEENAVNLIDRYTNLLTNLPDNAYTLTIEGILMLVKLLAHGALKGLPGLSAFNPSSDYLRRLNSSPPSATEYFAMAANFTPTAQGVLQRFGKWAQDKFIDSVFGQDNDGVVPTRGSYEAAPSSPGFPVSGDHRKVYEKGDQLHHNNFFTAPIANDQVVDWLTR